MKKYSIIIPVYNRPDEIQELLDSLTLQTFKNFEVIIVEDGSTIACKSIVDSFKNSLDIHYFYKDNSGPGESRNFGFEKAQGEIIVLFDSDCLIPSEYFNEVEKKLEGHHIDAYGGPDAAHASFTHIQKAINFAMTSFITTGGIRGKKTNLDNYQPRSFNMGIRKSVLDEIGGFSDIHPGEDPDLSYRIMNAGYNVKLIESAFVYHKRRIDFSKFAKQVYKFGVVRNILMKWYPSKSKVVYFFPSLFLTTSILLIFLSIAISKIYVMPFILLALILFLESLIRTKNIGIAFLSIPASYLQLLAYGYGFIIGFFKIHILKLNERSAFPTFFFK